MNFAAIGILVLCYLLHINSELVFAHEFDSLGVTSNFDVCTKILFGMQERLKRLQ